MISNSVLFSSPSPNMLGTLTNCGPSGVCDLSFFTPSLFTKTLFIYLFQISMKKGLISQHNSVISTIKVSKISTGKLSSWETSILLRNFVSC